MQVSREKAAENRERIMETAARMFREAHRRRRRDNERRRSHIWPMLSYFGSMDDLTAEPVTRGLCYGGFFGMIRVRAKLDVVVIVCVD
jgi:hypothetical protein